jgi:5-methylcytosine-specific restriction endonuclease McrA
MKTLLLNSTYEGISFISYRKVFKLFTKDKVEVLSSWDREIRWGKGSMMMPAVVRLRYRVRWIPKKMRFNRAGVFRRDKHLCQYCGEVFSVSKLTVDHVMPKARGGKSDWINCVASCFDCNNKKGDRTPAEARMRLLTKPVIPRVNLINECIRLNPAHEDWKVYLGISHV